MSMKLMAIAMSLKVGNPAKKLVLLKLCDNANDKGECWPSLQHIADQCEISRRTAINHVQSLEEDGFLIVENRFKNNEQISNFYIIDLEQKTKKVNSGGENIAPPPSANIAPPPSENSALGSEINSLGGENIAPPPSENSAHRTSHSFEPVIEPVIESKKHCEVSPVDNIFEYWKTIMNHPRAKLDEKRKKKIREALKLGYTQADLIAAIDGCAKSPYHMGSDGRNFTVYDDLELILRDAKHIDQFLKINSMPKAPMVSQAKFDPMAYVNKARPAPAAGTENNNVVGFVAHAN